MRLQFTSADSVRGVSTILTFETAVRMRTKLMMAAKVKTARVRAKEGEVRES